MVDDFGSEDLNSILVREVLGIRHDLDIEGKHTGVLLVGSLVSGRGALHCLQHVFLMDRANVDGTDWDLTLVEELEQGLQRTDS